MPTMPRFGPIVSSTRAIAISPPTFTSSGKIKLQSSGLTHFGCKGVAGFLGWRSIEFKGLLRDTGENFWRLGMRTSAVDIEVPNAGSVTVTEDTLSVDLSDGRTISVPLSWYPRLLYASQKERRSWRLIGKGQGIHWEGIDEDVSVEGLLAGKPSAESQSSFAEWLAGRTSRPGKRLNGRSRRRRA